jgi:hypothetical protein
MHGLVPWVPHVRSYKSVPRKVWRDDFMQEPLPTFVPDLAEVC